MQRARLTAVSYYNSAMYFISMSDIYWCLGLLLLSLAPRTCLAPKSSLGKFKGYPEDSDRVSLVHLVQSGLLPATDPLARATAATATSHI